MVKNGSLEKKRERGKKGVRKWVNIYLWIKRRIWDFLLTPLLNSKQAIDELEEGEFGDVMQGIWARERGDWLVSKKRKSLGQKMKLRGSLNRGKGNGMDGVDLENNKWGYPHDQII